MYTYIHIYIHTYTYIHIYIHTYIRAHTATVDDETDCIVQRTVRQSFGQYILHVTYMHTYLRAYIHTYIHTNIYAHTYYYY